MGGRKKPPEQVNPRYVNKGPTPREREEDRIVAEVAQMLQYKRQLELAEEYGKNLRKFLKAAWPVLSPGTPFTPGWHVDAICEHVQALLNRDIRRLIINIAPRSLKAVALDTKIPTPGGMKTMADIHRGDKVFDNYGNPCTVLEESEVFQDSLCYEVSFSTGEKVVVDAGHLWKVTSRSRHPGSGRTGREPGLGGIAKKGTRTQKSHYLTDPVSIQSTIDLLFSVDIFDGGKRRSNHKVEVARPINMPELHLPVHPYVLGAWLGDGTSATSDITCAYSDIEIIDRIRQCGETVVERKKNSETTGLFAIGGGYRNMTKTRAETLQGRFRALGLLRNKHIPEVYFCSSEMQRLDLLKGLMDTDGSIDEKGRATFNTTSPRLMKDVKRLIASLGFKPSVCSSVAKLNGRVISNVWFVSFTAYDSRPVFSLSRKRNKQVPERPRGFQKFRTIVSIKRCESVPVKCIAVDSPENLYLITDGYIPTHNSKIISVAAVAWRWIEHPEEQFLCASYGRGLALDFSRQTRNLIASPWYQGRWKEKFQLEKDQNEKGAFENNKGGARLAYSVEGGVLGRGGSASFYDDANDLNEMQSPVYRQSVKDWYSGSASSRFINPQTDVRLCVQQRAPYGDDLTSFLLELGGWEQLVIPMEYDGNKRVSSIGWSDPRTHLGELMHPARFGPLEIDQLKKEQRDNWAGQFNQSPVGNSGDTLKSSWFRFYNPPGVDRRNELGEIIPVVVSTGDGNSVKITPIELPSAFEQVVISADLAFKNAEHNDFVAAHVWARLGANSFLIAREHGHLSFTETKAMIRRLSGLYPCPEKLVEDAANGPAILDELRNEVPGLIPVPAYGSKWSRVAAIAGYVEAGNVYLPNPDLYPWVWNLLREFADGRSSKHDDDTDAMSQALKRLYDTIAQSGLPEFRVQPRIGEPQTACHVARDLVPATWRRIVAIVPGQAAIWLSETPTGSLRVLRELSLDRLDAEKAGREIGRRSLPDCLARIGQIHEAKKQVYELFFPKEAFAAVEPVGSYAEMLEKAILTFEPEEPDYDARVRAQEALRAAHFRSDMVEEEEAALDRLRGMLEFQPPDFKPLAYERRKAFSLAEEDIQKYADYMAACEGEVRGEWPKLKIDPECRQLIAELGTFRRDRPGDAPPFVKALLLGVCCPRQNKVREIVERPWGATGGQRGFRNTKLMSRKFAMR